MYSSIDEEGLSRLYYHPYRTFFDEVGALMVSPFIVALYQAFPSKVGAWSRGAYGLLWSRPEGIALLVSLPTPHSFYLSKKENLYMSKKEWEVDPELVIHAAIMPLYTVETTYTI